MESDKLLSPEDLKREQLKALAFELRIKGMSFSKIGYELKVARTTATNYVKSFLDDINRKDQSNLLSERTLELERLNSLIFDLYQEIKNADDILDDNGKLYRDGLKTRLLITDRILKIIDMRCKLLGLYAPEKIEQFVITEDSTEVKVDYSRLSTEELKELFAKQMRESSG